MPLPSLNRTRKAQEVISIDLGGRTTKAVHLQRKGQGLVLLRYALLDAPVAEKSPSINLLSEHLKNLVQALEAKTRRVVLSLGLQDAVVRSAELPLMPVSDMRMVLKNNPKAYLQQDLQGYVFDCSIIPPKATTQNKQTAASPITKVKVLAAGTRQQTLNDLQVASRQAGLAAEQITPGLIGPVNAFERAFPDVFLKETMALVDIGFKNSGICILQEGEIILNRVVNIGGDRITQGLADALGISYAEAEGIKIGMPAEVQSHLESLVLPLGRELRASIDFFEHQQDKVVSKIYISGAAARSPLILELLQRELMTECKSWNPGASLELMLPPQQVVDFEQVSSQLTVAIGGAIAAL